MFELLVLLMRWGYLVLLSTRPLMKTHLMLKLAEFVLVKHQVSSCSECSICCCNLWMYDSAFRIWMNALFVEMCREHGINFIGPNVVGNESGFLLPDRICVMDDKSTAGDTMKNSGVPTVPGSNGLYFVKGISTKEAIRLAKEIGYPVMIKAAKSEATAAFSNDGVYLEKYIQNPRHVEFQDFKNGKVDTDFIPEHEHESA
ncbi:hypothetical protein DCAR_0832700 [Daucus carota subsp. sativus]|uniref:Carbamoyl phosphate synthase ATP-binding domain-containing protein n=1 Tax=Daucus carota subsp. sativus TaxID=79200 RepID=A0A175YR40_DAUCS|nr:hypothetical protein DCAR_0832700 [Daucus carota subsp. sativus]